MVKCYCILLALYFTLHNHKVESDLFFISFMSHLRAALTPWLNWSIIIPLWRMGWSQPFTTLRPNATSPPSTVSHPTTTSGRWSARTSQWNTSLAGVSTARCTRASGRSTILLLLWKHWRFECPLMLSLNKPIIEYTGFSEWVGYLTIYWLTSEGSNVSLPWSHVIVSE